MTASPAPVAAGATEYRRRVRFCAPVARPTRAARSPARCRPAVRFGKRFGNAVLEAMQRGLPAIVTPDVGAAEVVPDAGGGLVVDGDPESLGHAIDRLAGDPALARAMGEAGRRYVSEHYSWPSVAARMEALYESMREAKPACSTRSPP